MSKASEKKKKAREKAIQKARNLTRGGAKRGESGAGAGNLTQRTLDAFGRPG